ncbi:CRM-domain containing factor CFM3A, chloroplastic/mitochondrial-like [Apium graveolens]|uniref:CRM-domain containing factor CFM3A, chloroplastic/mitochondrial-like n=1 Tax=Apium graveolens TaxID=4045 RepID=UPI003D7A87F9
MTFIRRVARTMPPHFALRRNRELQGLAKAVVKLWDKSAIAKIAIKRDIYNTLKERMAEELKVKLFILLILSETLVKVQNLAAIHQDEEDWARQKAFDLIELNTKASKDHMLVAGTLAETMAATSRWGNQPTD